MDGRRPSRRDAEKGDSGVPQDIIAHLKLREGWRTAVYKDSLGKPTVGMGHLLTADERRTYKLGDEVPVAVLEAWAQRDAKKAYEAAQAQAATCGVSDHGSSAR
ncbi:glycoside hydrolase family protein [Haliangium sp.]|uniref:glycoside hydrolase family protein n=1 Tax=Haliangium sp. TaxID=2663208 RepID=UPI003D0D2479